MTPTIHQGCKYRCGLHSYIALESGSGTVKVARIDNELQYPLHAPVWVHSSQLKPLPMVYFHNQVQHG